MSEFNPSFYCPITQELMEDPVFDAEGNTYERAAITAWLNARGTSPITRVPMSAADLVPNRALRDAIENERHSLPTRMPDGMGPLIDRDGDAAAAAAATGGGGAGAAPVVFPDLSLTTFAATVEDVGCGADYADEANAAAAGSDLYVVTRLASPGNTERVASDIIVVVDVSGSMGGEAKAAGIENSNLSLLDIVKHAVKTTIQTLGDNDRLAIVSYSNAAVVVCELCPMTTAGKARATSLLNGLVPDGMTNLWDGLHSALELLKARTTALCGGIPGNARNAAIMLLTDGEPNIEPPRGHLPMLKRYADSNGGRYPGIINTFGFGYRLDSILLRDLAVEGGGMYAFIPDSGFVGTVFVNALANTLVTVAAETKVNIEAGPGVSFSGNGAIGQDKVMPASWGASVSLGSVQAGQALTIVTRVNATTPDSGNLLTSTLLYRQSGSAFGEQKDFSVTGPSVYPDSPALMQEVANETFRVRFVQCISGIMFDMKQIPNRLAHAQELVRSLVASIRRWLDAHPEIAAPEEPGATSPPPTARARIQGILADLEGQVTEALSRDSYFTKWGRHYLPSLQRAHELQQCNNFKDPGIQFYGGVRFREVRDHADDIFCSLPAPVPQPSPYANLSSYGSAGPAAGRGGGGGGGGVQGASRAAHAAPAPISMASFNRADTTCFHGSSCVTMADGSARQARDVKKGDVLLGCSTVICVLRTDCAEGKSLLVTVPGTDLILTSYHPVQIQGKWVFPIDLAEEKEMPCEAVYSFLASAPSSSTSSSSSEYAKVVTVGGVVCAALAHGIENDPVLSHPFFGTDLVVSAMQQCAGWEKGVVAFAQVQGGSFITRDAKTGLVNGFDSAVATAQPMSV